MSKKTLYILLLLISVYNYGQVTLAVSEIKDPKVNQKFNLTILLEISGENMEQETPLRMPDLSKFDIIGSASEQNTVVLDAKKGDVLNQMIYQYVLSPKQTGKIKFGSVLVTVNGKIYKTEPFDITVRESEKNSTVADNSYNSVHLSLEIQDKEIYKNEPTLATLRAHSRDYNNFRKVNNIQVPKQKNIKFKPVNLAKSEIETHSGTASQVIGIFMIFSSESGIIEVPAVSAFLSGVSKEDRISSNKVKIKVKKLPVGMPEDFKNAVGNFNVSASNVNANEIPEVEKAVNISLKLSGSGNFGTLQLPKIVSSENYVFFAPKITTKTITKYNGQSGDITANYVVIPKKTGPVSINFENFTYFDPEENTYVDLGSKSVLLNVKTHEQVVDAKTTLEKVNDYTNTVLETVNTPVLQTHNLKIKDKSKINWKIVAGNLAFMVGLLSLFLMVRKKMAQQKTKPIITKNPVITIAETEEIIRKQMTHQFDDHIIYLKKLAGEKDFTKFFSTYDELKEETMRRHNISTESDFRKHLELNNGQQFADKYRELTEKLQIEKYAPYHTEEHIDEILNAIISLYSEIRK